METHLRVETANPGACGVFINNLEVMLHHWEIRSLLSTLKEMWRANQANFRLTIMPTIEFKALK